MINFFKKLFNKSPKELFASFFQKIKNLFRAGSANQSQENNEPPQAPTKPQEPTNPTQAPTQEPTNPTQAPTPPPRKRSPKKPTNPTQAPTPPPIGNEPPTQDPTSPPIGNEPPRNRINVADNLPFRPPVSPMGPVSMPRTSSGSSRGSR